MVGFGPVFCVQLRCWITAVIYESIWKWHSVLECHSGKRDGVGANSKIPMPGSADSGTICHNEEVFSHKVTPTASHFLFTNKQHTISSSHWRNGSAFDSSSLVLPKGYPFESDMAHSLFFASSRHSLSRACCGHFVLFFAEGFWANNLPAIYCFA